MNKPRRNESRQWLDELHKVAAERRVPVVPAVGDLSSLAVVQRLAGRANDRLIHRNNDTHNPPATGTAKGSPSMPANFDPDHERKHGATGMEPDGVFGQCQQTDELNEHDLDPVAIAHRGIREIPDCRAPRRSARLWRQ
jgi:hypothetical protein